MNEVDKVHLLELARQTIASEFSKEELDYSHVRHLDDEKAVFVKLTKKNNLRGGMGVLEPKPLPEAVVEATRKAAFEDPRFSQVKENELSSLKIEISVMGKKEVLVGEAEDYPEQVEGYGLMLEGVGRAILLPSVAKKNMYTPVQFLNALAQKAGLSFNAWKESRNRVYRFRAEIFSE